MKNVEQCSTLTAQKNFNTYKIQPQGYALTNPLSFSDATSSFNLHIYAG